MNLDLAFRQDYWLLILIYNKKSKKNYLLWRFISIRKLNNELQLIYGKGVGLNKSYFFPLLFRYVNEFSESSCFCFHFFVSIFYVCLQLYEHSAFFLFSFYMFKKTSSNQIKIKLLSVRLAALLYSNNIKIIHFIHF